MRFSGRYGSAIALVLLGALSCSGERQASDDSNPRSGGTGGSSAAAGGTGGSAESGGTGGSEGGSAGSKATGGSGGASSGTGGGTSATGGTGGDGTGGTGGGAGEAALGCGDGADAQCKALGLACAFATGECRAPAECDVCASDADCGEGFICYNFSDAGVRLCSQDGTCCQPPGTDRCVVDLDPPNVPVGYTTLTCYPEGTCAAPGGDASGSGPDGSGGSSGSAGSGGSGNAPGIGGGPPGMGGGPPSAGGGPPGMSGFPGMPTGGTAGMSGDCETGMTQCADECVNTDTDASHCGACGYECPPGSVGCAMGVCVSR